MPRWKPDAADRLARAALELFVERGYDTTTLNDIAERAGLTKTTFFRHFRDKREVLFGGTEGEALLQHAVAAAPSEAAPFELVILAMTALDDHVYTAARLDFITRRRAVIEATPELQERDALKNRSLVAALADAMIERGVAGLSARVAAELGALASQMGADAWVEHPEESYVTHAQRALEDVRVMAASG